VAAGTRSRRAPVASATAKTAARSKVLRISARRPARIAPMAMAVATCDFPTPGGPIRSTPLCDLMKRALANSTIFVFGILGLKAQSKSASVLTVVIPACLSRRAKSRSARRASSSSTSNSRNSRWGSGAASAWATRPGLQWGRSSAPTGEGDRITDDRLTGRPFIVPIVSRHA